MAAFFFLVPAEEYELIACCDAPFIALKFYCAFLLNHRGRETWRFTESLPAFMPLSLPGCLVAFLLAPLCFSAFLVQKLNNKTGYEKVVPARKLALCGGQTPASSGLQPPSPKEKESGTLI